MAKPTDLEGRFDQAMKKGDRQDAKKRGTANGYMVSRKSKKGFSPAEKAVMKKIDSAKKISGSM